MRPAAITSTIVAVSSATATVSRVPANLTPTHHHRYSDTGHFACLRHFKMELEEMAGPTEDLTSVPVTVLATLPGHPVMAVGLASGQLSIVYLHAEEVQGSSRVVMSVSCQGKISV